MYLKISNSNNIDLKQISLNLSHNDKIFDIDVIDDKKLLIVIKSQDDLKAAALNLTRFFEDESCGQCTPCRIGTEKACDIMSQKKWDTSLLNDLCDAMADASICGVGQAAPNPIRSVMKYFPEEIL